MVYNYCGVKKLIKLGTKLKVGEVIRILLQN